MTALTPVRGLTKRSLLRAGAMLPVVLSAPACLAEEAPAAGAPTPTAPAVIGTPGVYPATIQVGQSFRGNVTDRQISILWDDLLLDTGPTGRMSAISSAYHKVFLPKDAPAKGVSAHLKGYIVKPAGVAASLIATVGAATLFKQWPIGEVIPEVVDFALDFGATADGKEPLFKNGDAVAILVASTLMTALQNQQAVLTIETLEIAFE